MIHERRKVAKIVEELTIFFFSVGAAKMSSSIEYDGSMANITFRSDFEMENRYKVMELEKYFSGIYLDIALDAAGLQKEG